PFGPAHPRHRERKYLVTLPASQVEHEADSERKAGVIGNCPDPAALLRHSPKLRLDVLERLHDNSVLSAAQFDRDLLCELAKLAAYLQLKQFPVMHALEDKIMAAAFFEPS